MLNDTNTRICCVVDCNDLSDICSVIGEFNAYFVRCVASTISIYHHHCCSILASLCLSAGGDGRVCGPYLHAVLNLLFIILQ